MKVSEEEVEEVEKELLCIEEPPRARLNTTSVTTPCDLALPFLK